MSTLRWELVELKDFHQVDKHSQHKNAFSIGLELELWVEVKLSDEESTKYVLCEYFDNTPFNIYGSIVSEN